MSSNNYFSVCPHDTAKGVERWAMFHAVVAKHVSPGSRYVPYFNFKEFDLALRAGVLLWGYLNPAQFLLVRKLFGYLPIAIPTSKLDKVVFVAPKDTSARSLEDFAGKRLALSPGYLSAVARKELASRNVAVSSTMEVRGYSEVLRALSRSEADVGISYNEHHDALTDLVRSEFVVVAELSIGLSHVVVAHPQMPETKRSELTKFLLTGHTLPATKKGWNSVGITTFEPVDVTPFEALAEILNP